MKTWEMIKELTENPNKKFYVVGSKHLIARVNFETNKIEFVNTSVKAPYIGIEPTIDWDWKEVKEPVGFMEAVESGKKVRVEHDFIHDDTSRLKEEYVLLDVMLWVLGENLGPRSVQDIIMNGKFYIED